MQSGWDLMIVGGGVNGSALARLAAFQGWKVCLLESGDFGEGTSTATSKLIHGGLRYLENLDFGLVRESVVERGKLLNLAPHLVQKQRLYFPQVEENRNNRFKISLGLGLYSKLAGRWKIDKPGWLSKEQLQKQQPAFRNEKLSGAHVFEDCLMDDARFVLENVLDAKILGAQVLNYHKFEGVEEDDKGDLEVTVYDRIRQKHIIHSTKRLAFTLGPWTDKVVSNEFSQAQPQLHLSCGSHLVLAGLRGVGAWFLPVPNSRRYFFVLPWKDMHLVGTTEAEVTSDKLDHPSASKKEINELLQLFQHYFPELKVNIVSTFSGIRPLARKTAGKKGKSDSVRLSRRHKFYKLHEKVFSAVGGKFTTHRILAEEYLQFLIGKKSPIRSLDNRPLPGAWKNKQEKDNIDKKLKQFDFSQEKSKELLFRYGKRSVEVASFISRNTPSVDKYSLEQRQSLAECWFCIKEEMALSPIDFLRRRSDFFFNGSAGLDILPEIEKLFDEKVPGWRNLGETADYNWFLKRNKHSAVS